MLRDYVLSFFNEALIVIGLIYIIVKVMAISANNVRQGYVDTFIGSIQLYSRQSIRNTFDNSLKKYLKVSNKVNLFFYAVAAAITALYVMMRII
jgi:hypothetical protein